MPEQLRLEQRVRNRAAVDGHERFARACAVVVNRARHQFLAHAAFADDEHWRRRIGRMRDLLVHLEHRRRPSDQTADLARGHLRGTLAAVRALLERAIDDPLDVGDVERLADVVERARAHGLDGGLECAEAADQHDGTALLFGEASQQIESRTRRVEIDVGNQQRERVVTHPANGGLGILHGDELPAGRLQQLLEKPACLRVVVHQKNANHALALGRPAKAGRYFLLAAGSVMTNTAPAG